MSKTEKATAKKSAAKKVEEDAPITLAWTLAELPSAQHRAGLAGLVMMVQWMTRKSPRPAGVLELHNLSAAGVELRVDRVGMRSLFDEVYAASTENVASKTKRKDKNDKEIAPADTTTEAITDPKTKKQKTVTTYWYPAVIPRGAFLLDEEPGADGKVAPWLKLWRDLLWSVLRGVPATREPFEARAEKRASSDADDVFDALVNPRRLSVDLASTYYLGAQASTADNVSFTDRTKWQFLLHFWPYACSVYVPALVDPREGTTKYHGFAVVMPDVSHLEWFAECFFASLRERNAELRGYRPKAAVVDLAVESALSVAMLLRERLKRLHSGSTDELVLGYEVFHLNKEGNNVRLYSVQRMDPSVEMVDQYATIQKEFRDHFFKRQRLLNLVHGARWYAGFDRLAETLPYKTQFIGSSWFRADARAAFKSVDATRGDDMADEEESPETLEKIVMWVVRNYVNGRVKARTGLERKKVNETRLPQQVESFNKELERAARDAFLGVRSRTGADFIAYFTSTLCSVRQPMRSTSFDVLSRALRDETENVRTVTMLALSTVTGVYTKETEAKK